MTTPTPTRPAIMGILNVTPDSFSDGGAYANVAQTVTHAIKMSADGAQYIDIGAESTRPGAMEIPPAMQLARLLPVLKEVRKQTGGIISIDTRSAAVAAACLDEGAGCINDVSALRHDPKMAGLLARSSCEVILMHMQGTPETMQDRPAYTDVVAEIAAFFQERAAFCRELGLAPNRLWFDPGFGFGKTHEHNLEIMRKFRTFESTGLKLAAGVSRKGFLGRLSGEKDPARRDRVSIAAGLYLAERGAMLLRVHDVAGHVAALRVRDTLRDLETKLSAREGRDAE